MIEKNSYRKIVKATTLFGGVQLVKVFSNIISSKVIAVILGPAGIGLIGLYNSSLALITSLTNLGLSTSSVKSIASVSSYGNQELIEKEISITHKLFWLSAILGTLLTFIFSDKLSFVTFGNNNYSNAFKLLSFSIFFNQLTSGKLAILQGLQKHKYLANSILTGTLLGLIISIPIYYFFKFDGIVPVIIITSVINYFRGWLFVKKTNVQIKKYSFIETLRYGNEVLTIGLIISLSGIITNLAAYVTKVYVTQYGSLEKVGLYNAGFTLINGYLSLVLTAMATDYFPRLAAQKNNHDLKSIVNQQAELLILLITPILVSIFLLDNFLVKILYSNNFIEIKPMVYWLTFGMLFRTVSWTLSFTFVARGNYKIFFWNELIANVYFVILNLFLYHYFDLIGLGISFLIGYLLYMVQMQFLAKKMYNFSFNKEFLYLFYSSILIILPSFVLTFFFTPIKNFFLIPFLLISIIFSGYHINKKIDILDIFKK